MVVPSRSRLALMMRGVFASAALLLAAKCAPFSDVSEASDSGAGDGAAGDSGGGDSGASDGGGAADSADAAGVVFIRQVGNTASNTAALTVTLPSPPAAGHALVLVVGTDDAFPSGVTGGGVSSWINPAQSGTHVSTAIWVGLGVSQATPSITVTWSTAQPHAAAILTEWEGLSAFDSAGTANKGVTTTAIVTPFAAQPGQLLFAAAGTEAPVKTPPTGGFSALDAVHVPSAFDVLGAYQNVGSAGTYGTSWTISTAIGWDTILVALH